MLGSYLECLFLGGFPWLLPKSSFYLPGRVCCVGSESVGAQWQCHPQGHPVCPSWPCWSCPSAAPSSSPPAHGGMEGPCQPCCCSDKTTAQGTVGSVIPDPASSCLSQLPPPPFWAWFGSCWPLLHQRDSVFFPRGYAVSVSAAFLPWISAWKFRQQPGDSCAPPSFICLPWLSQYWALLVHKLSRWSTDYLSSLMPPQKDWFHTTITLKKKLPPLSNPKAGVPVRGCDPQTAELPVQSLIWSYCKNQQQAWIITSPQPHCKYLRVPQDTLRSRGTQE